MQQNSFDPMFAAHRVGKHLKRELQKRNMTQSDFAELINVNERTVRRWISSGVDSLTLIFQIADCLGVNVRTLIFSEDEGPYFINNSFSYFINNSFSFFHINIKQCVVLCFKQYFLQ